MLVQTIKAPKQSMAEIALPDLKMLIICEVIGFIMRRSVPTDEIIGDGPPGSLLRTNLYSVSRFNPAALGHEPLSKWYMSPLALDKSRL